MNGQIVEIPLTQGKVAIIDAQDAERVLPERLGKLLSPCPRSRSMVCFSRL
jgi:hypothetical protein